jgi:hypothetical protein
MRQRLSVDKFIQETARDSGIKPGATAESERLNDLFSRASKDFSMLAGQMLEAGQLASLANNNAIAQAAGLQGFISSLSERVDTISSSSMVLVTMHSLASVVASSTTCHINTVFGQATLPISSDTNLLYFSGLDNKKYVDQNLLVEYCGTSEVDPEESDWQTHLMGQAMIKEESPAISPFPLISPDKAKLWVRVSFPFESLAAKANVLEIYPVPVFNCVIEKIQYNTYGASLESGWTDLDLSYLRGYNPTLYGNSFVKYAGPIRLFLPNTNISAIRIKMSMSNAEYWGLHRFRLKHLDFEDSGQITIQNPYNYSIGNYYLYGQPDSGYNDIAVSLAGRLATLNVAGTDRNTTPVLTKFFIVP